MLLKYVSRLYLLVYIYGSIYIYIHRKPRGKIWRNKIKMQTKWFWVLPVPKGNLSWGVFMSGGRNWCFLTLKRYLHNLRPSCWPGKALAFPFLGLWSQTGQLSYEGEMISPGFFLPSSEEWADLQEHSAFTSRSQYHSKHRPQTMVTRFFWSTRNCCWGKRVSGKCIIAATGPSSPESLGTRGLQKKPLWLCLAFEWQWGSCPLTYSQWCYRFC